MYIIIDNFINLVSVRFLLKVCMIHYIAAHRCTLMHIIMNLFCISSATRDILLIVCVVTIFYNLAVPLSMI